MPDKPNLNIDKSAFLIINPKYNNGKSSLALDSGMLKYKSSYHGCYHIQNRSVEEGREELHDKKEC